MTNNLAYVKVHDLLPEHPKIERLSDAAFRLYISSLCWCGRHTPLGVFPAAAVTQMVKCRRVQPLVRSILGAGLWHDAWHDCLRCCRAETGEYVIHDFIPPLRPIRQAIPDDVRYAVYDRDGWRCRVCGATEPLSLDHIWPWSLGGPDTIDNLQTLCIPCNCRKGARA